MTIRVADLPDLGAVTDATSFVGDCAGTGRMTAAALRTYMLATAPWVTADALAFPKTGGAISGATMVGPGGMFADFGTPMLGATSTGYQNCIIGQITNSLPPATFAFPTGVTGYGVVSTAGNGVFGIFGRADLGKADHSTVGQHGAAVNELNSFNFNGTPSDTLPPNLAFGAPEYNCNALQIVAYGDYPSTIGLYIAKGDQPFKTGIYLDAHACLNQGLLIDSDTTAPGALYGARINNYGTGINLQLQTTGPYVAGNAALIVTDATGFVHFSIKQSGDVLANNITAAATAFTSLTVSGVVSLGATTVGGSLAVGSGGNLTVAGNIDNTTGRIQNNGFLLNSSGLLTFRTATLSTSCTVGSASVLPSNPQGYVTVQINGGTFKLPYYNT